MLMMSQCNCYFWSSYACMHADAVQCWFQR